MVDLLWDGVTGVVIVVFSACIVRNIWRDLRGKAGADLQVESVLISPEQTERRRNILFAELESYLGLIAVATALSIGLVMTNSYHEIMLLVLEYGKANDVGSAVIVLGALVGGFAYAKSLQVLYDRSKMGRFEEAVRARALVSGILALACFALVFNMRQEIQGEYQVIKSLNLSFVAGMGAFFVFGGLPDFLSLFGFNRR